MPSQGVSTYKIYTLFYSLASVQDFFLLHIKWRYGNEIKKYKEDNHVDWSVITDTFNVWVWSEERKN